MCRNTYILIQMLEARTPKIRVLVRKRPLNKRELSRNETDIVVIEKDQTVIVKEQKYNSHYADSK